MRIRSMGMAALLAVLSAGACSSEPPPRAREEAARPRAPSTVSPSRVDVSAPLSLDGPWRRRRLPPSMAFRRVGGGLAAHLPTLDARAAEDGALHLTPHEHGAVGGADALGLETVDVASGARSLLTRAQVRDVEGHVEIRRGAVTEVVHASPEGLEQSWRFAAPPSDRGDLVVRVRTSGLPFAKATPNGLHFRRDGLALRYGVGTWIDARGRRSTIVPVYEHGQIVLRVPREVVTSSAFPAVLDPTVLTEVSFDEPAVLGPAPGTQTNPTAAWDGQKWLVAWTDYRGERPVVMSARVDANGNVLDPSGVVLLSPPTQSYDLVPYLASNGSGFLLVVRTENDAGPALHSIALDAAGKAQGTLQTVTGSYVDSSSIAVATDGRDYALVYTRYLANLGQRAIARRVSRAGVPDARELLLSPETTNLSESYSDLAFDGTNYVVAYYRNNTYQVLGRRLTPAGAFVEPAPVALVTLANTTPGGPVRIGAGGADVLVAWSQRVPSGQTGGYNLYSRLFPTGNLGTPSSGPLLLANGTVNEHPASVFYDGAGTFGVGFRDGAVRMRAVGTGGVVGATTHTLFPSHTGEPRFVSGTPNALVVAGVNTPDPNTNFNINAATVSAAGEVVPSFIVSRAAQSQVRPAVAHDPKRDRYLTTWFEVSTAGSQVVGAIVKGDGTLEQSGGQFTKIVLSDDTTRPVNATVFTPSVTFDGDHFLVAWESGSQVYLRRVMPDTTLPDPAPFRVFPAAPSGTRQPALAFDGTSTILVYREDAVDELRVARLGADGLPRSTERLEFTGANDNSNNYPSVACDGTSCLVAWQGEYNTSHIYGAVVSGDVVVKAEFPIGTAFASQRSPRVAASSAGGFFVTWSDFRTSFESADVYGARVTSQGEVLDDPRVGLKISNALDIDESAPDVVDAQDGANWLVVWRDRRRATAYDIMGALVAKADGALRHPTGFVISAGESDEGAPGLARGNGRALVVYERVDTTPGVGSPRVKARFILPSQPNGAACKAAVDCASNVCVDGLCCETPCDEGCGTCSAQPGKCTPVPGGTKATKCVGFRCDGVSLACKTRCEKDEDCAAGFSCDVPSGQCISAGARCADAQTVRTREGALVACAPFKCLAAACTSSCVSVDDCTAPAVCDDRGQCVPPPPPPAGTKGCNAGGADGGTTSVIAAALVALVRLASRRRRAAGRAGRGRG